MSLWSDLKGTLNSFFRVRQVLLKDDAGNLDVRNASDTAFVEVSALSFTKTIYERLDDFETALTGTIFTSTVSGTGAAIAHIIPYFANCIGVIRLSTGTTATGRAAFVTGVNAIRLGNGTAIFDAIVRPVNLPTMLEDFTVRIGFIDNATGDSADGVYFEFNSSNANWVMCAASSSTRTKTASSVAVVIDDTLLRVEVNAAGNRADFFINNNNVGFITTNIPTGVARETGWGAGIFKSVGTSDRSIDVDLIRVRINLTTPRRL